MKIFFKVFQKEKDIIAVKYTREDQKNYFNFVKSQLKKNMRQVIITSEIMLNIMEKIILEHNFCKINTIKFTEDDSELNDDIKSCIDSINTDKNNINKLLTKLECISDSSSIDIEEIEITVKENNDFISLNIWVNGIIKIELKNNENEIMKKILKIIKENLEI